MHNKRIIVDLDGTLCEIKKQGEEYIDLAPKQNVIERLREYKAAGFMITVSTSRNMRTFDGDLEKIRMHTLPVILDWLARHEVPYDEVLIGKPWPGEEGFYIDDRTVRPDEFAALSAWEIEQLLNK